LKSSVLQVTNKIDDDLDSDEENKIPAKAEKESNSTLKGSDSDFEFELWKKNKHYPIESKIFIVVGEYRDIRENLLKKSIHKIFSFS
jgi:hypothetical protein